MGTGAPGVPALMPGVRQDYESALRWSETRAGVIRINEAITDRTATVWLREIALIKQRGLRNCRVLITSPGGGAYAALAIYDALVDLANSGCKITATVEGLAASAAAMIVLQAATVRNARAHARFLVHECRRWVFFSVERTSDIRDEAKEMESLAKVIWDILAKRCGKTTGEVEALVERKEVWMSATEAKEWGLIDAVL